MSLRTLEPPAGTLPHLRKRLAVLATGEGFHLRGMAGAGALRLAAPHPVFNLAVERIGTRNYADYAVLTGWRFFLADAADAIGMVEAEAGTRFERPRFARVSAGRMVACAVRALHTAEQTPRVQAGDYVLGMLRVPTAHMHALWLRDGSGRARHDLFIPLEPAPSVIEAGRLMGPVDFGRALSAARASMEHEGRTREMRGRSLQPSPPAPSPSPPSP